MAGHAGRACEIEIAVHVAIGAETWRHRMCARQSESRGGVVELAIGPLHCIVASFAGGRESAMWDRSRRPGIVFLVTGIAGRAAQIVVVINVAVGTRAGRNRVRTDKNKSGRRVIELAIGPLHGIVTLLASGRESTVRNWARGM